LQISEFRLQIADAGKIRRMAAISLIMPCRDEERFIAGAIESLLPQLNASDELIVVDGRSADRTREIVSALASHDSRIRLVDNPERHAAAAMNRGIKAAAGDFIVRVDAHCVYPNEYVQRLVTALDTFQADNVGGTWEITASSPTAKARAIARALAHPFGAGTARFRRTSSQPRWVDTVPFGCFRRSTFDRIGLFREELPANQDDEFNARLLNLGGKVLLLPDLEITYYARGTIADLWRTYFRYGRYKPLALKLGGGAVTLRQFVPGTWIVAMAGTLLWSVLTRSPLPWVVVWGAYAAAAISVAAHEAWKARSLSFGRWIAVAFLSMHVAYGVGWWSGLRRQ
jgi:glycosyltransferase involved in cell wall biosynthesis